MKDIRVEVSLRQGDLTDNRLLFFNERGDLIEVAFGGRAALVKAFNKVLAGVMTDAPKNKLQTHSLPKYVKEYFETGTIEMVREPKGYTFNGPNRSIYVSNKHADAARHTLSRLVKDALEDEKSSVAID